MEDFHISEVTVKIKIWHQFDDKGQSVRSIVSTALNFPAIESIEFGDIEDITEGY